MLLRRLEINVIVVLLLIIILDPLPPPPIDCYVTTCRLKQRALTYPNAQRTGVYSQNSRSIALNGRVAILPVLRSEAAAKKDV